MSSAHPPDIPTRPRCPNCDTPNSADAWFCSRCGYDLRTPPDHWQRRQSGPDIDSGEPSYWRQGSGGIGVVPPSGTAHRLLKWALAIWAIAFPVVSCSPLFATGADTGGAVAVGGLASLIVGATLFGPWILGLIVLGILVLVTK